MTFPEYKVTFMDGGPHADADLAVITSGRHIPYDIRAGNLRQAMQIFISW